MIADRDVAFYREQGYLVVPGVLGPTMVESLRRELDETLQGARNVTEHSDVYDLEPGHRPDAPRVSQDVASCGARGTPPQFP
jgi:Phytanoyl-CoA dioxygenase (PhyH)